MHLSANAARALRFATWGLLALWTFVGLDRPIGDGDESMHAEILREMLRSGDYLHTRWYGVVLHERPPLMYWFALPFARLTSSELGVRMSSALMSFAILWLVYRLACRQWGQPGAALTGTILLAAAPSYHVYTRTLMNEAPYLLALTLALAGTIEAQRNPRGLLLAAAGLGAAVAVKSLAAAVPLLALAPWLVSAARRHGARRSGLGALAIFSALSLPFFVLSLASDPGQFLREHVGFHLLERVRGGTLGMGGGAWAYVISIPQRDGPWISGVLLAGIGAGLWLGRAPEQRTLLLLSSYALLFFAAISLIGTHLPHYALPMYPPAMLAVSGVLAHAHARSLSFSRPSLQLAMPALAVVVLLESLPYSGGRDVLFERPYGRILGRKARELSADQPLFAYEWYGLSLGYYADHRVVLLTSRPERYAAINFPLGAIARAKAAALVPPLPAPVGSRIVIAGRVDALNSAAWLDVQDVLAAAPPYFLARARVRAPKPDTHPPAPTAATR